MPVSASAEELTEGQGEQAVVAEGDELLTEDVTTADESLSQPVTVAPAQDDTTDITVAPTDDDPTATVNEQTQPEDATVEATDDKGSDEVTVPDEGEAVTLLEASDETPTLPEGSKDIAEGTYVIETGIVAADKSGLAGHVMDAQGGVRNGAKIITWSYSGSNNQKWHIAKTDAGWYTIMPDSDRTLALTATIDTVDGKNMNRLYLTSYVEGLASQLWAFVTNSTSYGDGYQIVPQGVQASKTDRTITYLDNAKALDVRGGKPVKGSEFITYTTATAPRANQSYYLVNTEREAVAGGTTTLEGKYRVKVPGTNVALEIRKALASNGANAWLYTANGAAHQDVYLQHEGSGFYSLWIMGTKKVLDVRGSSILPGANVIQWAYRGTDNQLWSVRQNDNGSFTLVNKATGLALGAASETAGKSGTNLTGAQDNGRANNFFSLVRAALLSKGIYKIKDASSSKVLDVSKSSTANGAKFSFYTDTNKPNQRFELVPGDDVDLWRIRTGSSGGWINYVPGSAPTQQGNHATAATDNDTWKVVWREGSYMICSVVNGHVLGGGQKKVSMIKTSLPIQTGLVEIDAKLSGVALDNPRGSMTAGTKINVYKDNNGDNQKFIIEQVSGGYIITNYKSGKVLAVSGSSVVQQTYKSGNANQIWTAGIADGGYFKLINNATKKALDITGDSTVGTGSTATQVTDDTASREARQSWKTVGKTGWAKYKNVMSYFNGGTQITTSPQAYTLYKHIKNMKSSTRYLIAVYPDNPRLVIFKGSAGNWNPIKDIECGTGRAGADGHSVTLRGVWKLGEGRGEDEADGPALTPEAARSGKSAWLPSGYSGATYGYFIVGAWAIHSTIKDGTPVASQLNRMVSHGCIRVRVQDAKWIYDNMPRYTRVYSVPKYIPSNITAKLASYTAWANDQFR